MRRLLILILASLALATSAQAQSFAGRISMNTTDPATACISANFTAGELFINTVTGNWWYCDSVSGNWVALPAAGSGSALAAANTFFAGPASGDAAIPNFRASVFADLATFPDCYGPGKTLMYSTSTRSFSCTVPKLAQKVGISLMPCNRVRRYNCKP